MVADGGAVPSGIMNQAYHGAGAYVDYEQVVWKSEILLENDNNTTSQEAADVDPLFEASELLDRREEMADIIHAEMSVMGMCVLPDDNVTVTQRDAAAYVILATGDDELGSGNVDFTSATADQTDTDVGFQVDQIGRMLNVGPQYGYEDGANSAGGGSSGADRDGWSGPGHVVTADPTIDEREDFRIDVFGTLDQNVNLFLIITGMMTLGLYELEQPDVVRR